jgi:hypothetical protein
MLIWGADRVRQALRPPQVFAGRINPARFQMNEEQHVVGSETSPGEHFNGEEVGIYKDRHVEGDEILPGSILAPLGRRHAPC